MSSNSINISALMSLSSTTSIRSPSSETPVSSGLDWIRHSEATFFRVDMEKGAGKKPFAPALRASFSLPIQSLSIRISSGAFP